MAEKTLELKFRDGLWKGAFTDAPSATVTCFPSRVDFDPVLDIRYDTDLNTSVPNTISADAYYDFTRTLTVEV